MFDTLPQEVLRHILFDLPSQDIPSTSFVNKTIQKETSREGFWKEFCQHKFYSTKDFQKSEKETWKEHAETLEKAIKWNNYHAALKVNNKGYTITNVSSLRSSSSSPTPSLSYLTSCPSLCLGVAEKPLKEGPFSDRYFEVIVDSLPESKEKAQIIVGIAPFNILDNPAIDKVCGYINNGFLARGGPFAKEFVEGDRIGILLNTEYMTLSFFKNSELMGTPFSYLDKNIPWHPVVGLFYQGCQVSVVLPPRKEAPHMPIR